jgi:hypothetical protein
LEFDFASVINIGDPYNGLELYPGWGLVPGAAQVSYVDNIVHEEENFYRKLCSLRVFLSKNL